MIELSETLASIAIRFAAQLTAADRRELADVLDAAVEWSEDRLPLHVFANIGGCTSPTGRVSSAYTRYLATVSTAPADPRLDALRRAMDELIRYQGFILTTKGVFAPGDIPDVVIRRSAA